MRLEMDSLRVHRWRSQVRRNAAKKVLHHHKSGRNVLRSEAGFGLVEVLVAGSLGLIVASSIASAMIANLKLQIANESRALADNQIQLVENRMKLGEKAIAMERCTYLVDNEDEAAGLVKISATCSAGSPQLAKTVTREIPLPVNPQTSELITTNTCGLIIGEEVVPPPEEAV